MIKRYLIAFAVLLCAALAACSSKAPAPEAAKAEAEPVAPVEVATVTREPIDEVVTVSAILFPVNQANVMSKISAPIKRFYVNRGDRVSQGQLLASLESRDLAAAAIDSKGQYEQAQAAFLTTSGATMPEDLVKAQTDATSAQQVYDAAKRVYDSRVALVREGALAQKLADDAKVAMVQAQAAVETTKRHLTSLQTVARPEQLKGGQAQVESAKARYEGAQAQLSYAEIRSPIAGQVSDRPLFAGEIANAGSALVSIVDISQIIARANVPVKDAASIRVGKPATISLQGAEVQGKVTVVSPAVDPSTTTVEVWVQAPNPGARLKPGITAQVAIHASRVNDALVVPSSAILSLEEGGEKVMVVGADSAAHEKKVKIGVREGDKVQLLEGVNLGDRVITSGGLGLEDKAKVKVGSGKKEEDAKDDKKDDDKK